VPRGRGQGTQVRTPEGNGKGGQRLSKASWGGCVGRERGGGGPAEVSRRVPEREHIGGEIHRDILSTKGAMSIAYSIDESRLDGLRLDH